jgi:hypothetical protein
MATKRLVTAGAGLDWSNASIWSGGTVPVTGDVVLFDEGKEYRFDAGLSQGSVDLAGMFLPPSSGLFIDGAGTLTIDISNGDGQLSLLGYGIVRIDGDVDATYLTNPGMSLVGSGGNWTSFNSAGGRTELLESANLTRVFASGAGRVSVLASSGSDRVDELYIRDRNARVDLRRSLDAAVLTAGQLWLMDAATIHTGGTATVQGRDAVLNFAGTATAAAGIVGLAGVVDFQRHAADITVGTAIIDERSCRFRDAGPGTTVTVTSKTTVSPDYLGATMVDQSGTGSGA